MKKIEQPETVGHSFIYGGVSIPDMDPGRFVSYVFVYLGVLWLVEYGTFYSLGFGFPDVMYLGGGVFFLLFGVYRRLDPETREQYPAEHGIESYGFAVIAVALTVIFALQVL